jgi:hypothetical protein
MIIGKIDGTYIDSSLIGHSYSTDLVHTLCKEGTYLLLEDITRIDRIITKVSQILPPRSRDWIEIAGYADINDKTKTVTTDDIPQPSHCIFFNENDCVLKKFLAKPKRCEAYPIISIGDLQSLDVDVSGNLINIQKPAYIALKDKIILLKGSEFYNKLVKMLEMYN